MELITDRTQADVNRAKELNKKVYNAFAAMTAVATDVDALIEPMEIVEATLTAEEFAEWQTGLKGAYNYTDLNRVESAVIDIANLWIYGLATKTDWKMGDELTQNEMLRWLSNLQTIKEKSGSSIPIPANMSQLTYQSANNIEKMLIDAYAYKNMHTAGKLAVGDSLWLNVSGERKEFLIVHQGNPESSVYDSSCNGTWLLMKDIYIQEKWQSYVTRYALSTVASYLNNTFLPLLDATLPIKQVKIPVLATEDVTAAVGTTTTKMFLLSAPELGYYSSTYTPEEGTSLDYFKDAPENRIAYYNGVASSWWTRSKDKTSAQRIHVISNGGVVNILLGTATYGVRPALILDSNAVFTTVDNKKLIG